MKTTHCILLYSLLLFSLGCSEIKINESEKKAALQDYMECRQLADKWLSKLDSSDYTHLSTLKIADEIKVKNIEDSITSYINKVRKTYGKINSRKFIGAHIWSGKKLLTYMPEIEEKILIRTNNNRSEDGFYVVNPRYFGLSSAGQMFAGFPKGKYVVLMYSSLPTIKSYAEEALILWNNQGNWEVFTYKISDDI
jgi:hypothetical protein